MKRLLMTSIATVGVLGLGATASLARDDGFYLGIGAGYD